ncbi:MAG TPA: lysophospholipid acyltransferase family protein, partial [Chitinophagaceae bacterium]
RTIAKDSFARIPIFGWYYAKGSVLVNRRSDESRRRSFLEMKETLRQGMHMSVYPEGTRNRSNDPLKSFHDGAFRLAVETRNAVIPAVIFNTKKALPVHKTFYFMPHRVEIHFLPEIPVEGKTARELKEEVFRVMWDYYLQNSKSLN